MSSHEIPRRRILRAAGPALAAGLAGCSALSGGGTGDPAADTRDPDGSTARATAPASPPTVAPAASVDCSSVEADPPPTATADGATGTPAPIDLQVEVRVEDDESHVVTVAAERADVEDSDEERIVEEVARVEAGERRVVEGVGEAIADGGPGSYRVRARPSTVGGGAYFWNVPRGLQGRLSVVITAEAEVRIAEHTRRTSPPLGRETAPLPYVVPGADEPSRPNGLTLRNDRPDPTSVRVRIRHGRTSVLRNGYRIAPNKEVAVGPLTSKAGEFDVAVATGDGRCSTHAWRPTDWHPDLLVRIPPGGGPLIGCGEGGEEPVHVHNHASTPRTVSVAFRRDGRPLASGAWRIESDGRVEGSVTLPIGGEYEVVATAGGDTLRETVRLCLYVTGVVVHVGDGLRIERKGGIPL